MKFEKLLYIGFIIFVFASCTKQNDSSTDDALRIRAQQLSERSETSSSRSSCNSSRDGETTITTRSSQSINSSNAGDYRVSGKCDSRNREVTVSVGGQSLDTYCSGGKWNANIDVTSVIQGKDEVQISVRSGSEEACVDVDNQFQCPEQYVPVPRLDDFTDRDFCVMKYEARREFENRGRSSSSNSRYSNNRDNNYGYEKALASSSGDPWTEISHSKAKEKCENNGFGYRLIRNEEWQTIARHIEDEGSNWSSGKSTASSNNFLNYGILVRGRNLDGYRSSSQGRGSDNYANSDWYPEKRNHRLPNGEEVWDMSGGVWEYVEESTSRLNVKSGDEEPIFELSGDNKELFGPAGSYSEPSYNTELRNTTLGLGYAFLSNIEDAVIRGGGSSVEELGIFSVDASINNEDGLSFSPTGFRCVYDP